MRIGASSEPFIRARSALCVASWASAGTTAWSCALSACRAHPVAHHDVAASSAAPPTRPLIRNTIVYLSRSPSPASAALLRASSAAST